MTKWKFPNGDVVDQDELPEYLDNRFPGNKLYEMFEDEFNEQNNAAVVLYDYGGHYAYYEAFRDWIRDYLEYDPSILAGVTDMVPVSGSARRSGSKSCASKSGAPTKKAPAKKKAPVKTTKRAKR